VGQNHKEKKRERGSETGEGAQRPFVTGAMALLKYLCTGSPLSMVTPLLKRPVCLLMPGFQHYVSVHSYPFP